MSRVILTAIGVGGATIIGALLGFVIKKPSQKFSDIILSFAAGIMLCASVVGLILPSLEGEGKFSLVITILGVFSGALCLNFIDKIVPHLHKISGIGEEKHPDSTKKFGKIMLFVIAIAIHNFPEGIAAGVNFGADDPSRAFTVAGGIVLQNIPEGMVIISPLLSMGISPRRTFLIAFFTGVIEVIGTFAGYFAVSVSTAILPFALAFAGGTMLYVISDEMIPDTHSHGNERAATYALIAGFLVMLTVDNLL